MEDPPVERDQFRDAASRVLWQRITQSIERGVSFAEVNERLQAIEHDAPANPHFDTERDLLVNTLKYLSSSPTPAWMADVQRPLQTLHDACLTATEMQRRGFLRQIARTGGKTSAAAVEAGPGIKNRLLSMSFLKNVPDGLGALVDIATQSLEDTYIRGRNRLSHVLQGALQAAGFSPAPSIFGSSTVQQQEAHDLIAVLVNAAFEGSALRADFDPLGQGFMLPTGPDGRSERWHLAGLAQHLIWDALTVDTGVGGFAFTDLPPIAEPSLGHGASEVDVVVRASAAVLRQRIASILTVPISFEAVVSELDTTRSPQQFWSSTRAMWNSMVAHYAAPDAVVITDEWIEEALGESPTWRNPSPRPPTADRYRSEMRELCRLVGLHESDDPDQHWLFAHRLALLAYFEVTTSSTVDQDMPHVVGLAIEDCYLRLRNAAETTYRGQAAVYGLRPTAALFGTDPETSGVAFEIISLLTHAVYEGLLLRHDLDPAVATYPLPSGPDGHQQDWTLQGLAYFAIMTTCMEPIPSG